VVVYSKATLNDAASEQARQYVDVDPVWTRSFRELCRSLAESMDATAYRSSFTSVKQTSGQRCVHAKWTDPGPVSHGLDRSAESFWTSTTRTDFVPVRKPEETFRAVDQHQACYSRPFDLHPMTEKNTTTVREGYTDHMASKDDHPAYWNDHRVRVPPGSAVVGSVLGVPAGD
jgi:hypothetical protein